MKRFTLDDLPPELRSLPEPARITALAHLNDLLDKGVSEGDAVAQTRAQAENWCTERSESSLVDKRR